MNSTDYEKLTRTGKLYYWDAELLNILITFDGECVTNVISKMNEVYRAIDMMKDIKYYFKSIGQCSNSPPVHRQIMFLEKSLIQEFSSGRDRLRHLAQALADFSQSHYAKENNAILETLNVFNNNVHEKEVVDIRNNYAHEKYIKWDYSIDIVASSMTGENITDDELRSVKERFASLADDFMMAIDARYKAVAMIAVATMFPDKLAKIALRYADRF